MTPFSKAVIGFIQKVPKGKVATYGQISKLAGKPHGARGVSWIIHSCTRTHRLPWFRIVGAKGRIAMPYDSRGFAEQKSHLRKEGVLVSDSGRIDLAKFGWKRL